MYTTEKETLEALRVAHHEADERYVSHRAVQSLAVRLLDLEEDEQRHDAGTLRAALGVLLQDLLWDATREAGTGAGERDADMQRLADQLGLMLDVIDYAEVRH
ncbi:MAG: hypothetical protein AB7U65_04865 [Halothiobacillaceae bacterium]